MSSPVSHQPCYLVEWYRPQLAAAPLGETIAKLDAAAGALRDEGSTVRLVVTVAAPSDEVLYGVFAAGSPDTVIAACQRAGYPAERVTGGVNAWVTTDEPTG
ncbi:MAG: hypothetical protein ABWY93_20295 [Mycobacterium sp.]